MPAAGECSSHIAQMLVMQVRVDYKVSPRTAPAAAGLPHGEESIEHNTIHTIVDPLQQLGVVLGQLIGRLHAWSFMAALRRRIGQSYDLRSQYQSCRRR